MKMYLVMRTHDNWPMATVHAYSRWESASRKLDSFMRKDRTGKYLQGQSLPPENWSYSDKGFNYVVKTIDTSDDSDKLALVLDTLAGLMQADEDPEHITQIING